MGTVSINIAGMAGPIATLTVKGNGVSRISSDLAMLQDLPLYIPPFGGGSGGSSCAVAPGAHRPPSLVETGLAVALVLALAARRRPRHWRHRRP